MTVAYRYDIHPSHGLVVIRGEGAKWTGQDILKSAAEVVADEPFAPGFDWIYDLRYVHQTGITVEEVEGIVERFQVLPETRAAIPSS